MSKPSEELSAEQLLRIVLDTIPLRVFWKDKNSIFLGGNQLLLDDLSLSEVKDLIGKSDYDIVEDPAEAEHFIVDDAEVMRRGEPKLGIEEYILVPGKATKWLRTNKAPLINGKGEVIGVLGTYEDITLQVEYRQQIENQAMLDPLTGLANRRKLHDVLINYTGTHAGLLFIDLDFFKAVNDSLGHAIGDTLLQQVAKRLVNLVANNEQILVTRLGGDEFGILVPCLNLCDAQKSLETLASQIVSEILKPFVVEQHSITLGASVGITIVDKQNSSSTGFREADMAMYAAKAGGRNKFEFYDISMKKAAARKHQILYYLHNAIANKEFTLVYQAQIDQNNNLIGAEALLRWHNEILGFVAPDEFIPLAEESGFIHKIGEWVLQAALDELALWLPRISNSAFKMAVNFSSKQFQDESLVSAIEKALKERSISPNHLQIEITESVLIDNKERAIRSMLRLQKVGISIAIDDFGTGYSSLSYLAILPIDKLKIDRSFVTDLHLKSTNQKLVDTLVNMSKNLQMEVIAEGVETIDEKNALIRLGCRQFQGYFFSRPIPSEDFCTQYL